MADKNQEVKEIIVRAIASIKLADDWHKDISLTQRAMLRGRNPLEFAAGIIATMPDEYMPHIVNVANAITEATKG